MASALSSTTLSLSTARASLISSKTEPPRLSTVNLSWISSKRTATGYASGRMTAVRPVLSAPTPPEISEKIQESIEKAKETCAGESDSGECAAAWDEVEELSAAASHAREKAKDADPLEAYCKDNPETKECRTYED